MFEFIVPSTSKVICRVSQLNGEAGDRTWANIQLHSIDIQLRDKGVT